MIKENKKKVFLFGIDGAAPELIFDKWLDDLPNIKKLMEGGSYAKLNSTIPPSTIMAWNSMISGKDPSEFDVYSYTTKDSKGDVKLTNSNDFKSERIWDTLSKLGKKSIVLNVPLTYPIKPFEGIGASGFLTPEINEKSIYPKRFLKLIKEKFPEYLFDVSVGLASYKNLDKEEMIEKIYKMTEIQIEVLKYLLENEEWDFGMWVCIGSDRFQHTMWDTFDENHKDYDPDNKYKNVIKDYYKYLDKKLGEIVEILDENTTLIVASDHGFNRMDGRVNLNDWLINEGYLVMNMEANSTEKFDMKRVDWEKTKAYAIGAYFGRIYFNDLDENEAKNLQDEIIMKLKDFEKPNGVPMEMIFHKPQEVYSGKYLKNAPGLYVYFDNLIWGVNNDIGNRGKYSELTLLGSDKGGHAPQGIFVTNSNLLDKGNSGEIDVLEIYPLMMKELGEDDYLVGGGVDDAKLDEKDIRDSNNKPERVKIISTIGPGSNNPEILGKLKDRGVDFFRVNLSHTDIVDIEDRIKDLIEYDVPIILDTEGSQIRSGNRNEISFEEGNNVSLYDYEVGCDKNSLFLTPMRVFNKLHEGDLISIDFNSVLLRVFDTTKIDRGIIECKVVIGGLAGGRKAVQIQSNYLKLPAFSVKDYRAVELAKKYGIKHFTLSFMESKEDVLEFKKNYPESLVYSKIESKLGLDNFLEIAEVSEGVLIDRGDLSSQVDIAKIPFIQKYIIKKVREMGKEVFVATNTLEQMAFTLKPNKAEVNDIINTLLDGVSGFALTKETAVGENPIETVNMMNNLIDQCEFLMVESDKDILKLIEESDYIYSDKNPEILIKPHGGKLVNCETGKFDLDVMKEVNISEETLMDVEQIAIGAFSPISGFMNEMDFNSVVLNMRLANGVVWPLPIVFDLSSEEVSDLKVGDVIGLNFGGERYAKLKINDIYRIEKEKVVERIFGTNSMDHPGVKKFAETKEYFVGGEIELIKKRSSPHKVHELTPSQTRKIFSERGWKKVIGFHTRNVIHKSHEFMQINGMNKQLCDGLFVHPVIGKKKKGDFESEIIIKSYEKMIEDFYPKSKVILGTFATYSRYGGPREALFTALVRKNFGCSHFIVGRDHTGVGRFYGPHDSHNIFDKFSDEEIGIKAVKFDRVFYSNVENEYFNESEVNGVLEEDKLHISGMEARKMLKDLRMPPEWFMRPEISKMIIDKLKAGGRVFVE